MNKFIIILTLVVFSFASADTFVEIFNKHMEEAEKEYDKACKLAKALLNDEDVKSEEKIDNKVSELLLTMGVSTFKKKDVIAYKVLRKYKKKLKNIDLLLKNIENLLEDGRFTIPSTYKDYLKSSDVMKMAMEKCADKIFRSENMRFIVDSQGMSLRDIYTKYVTPGDLNFSSEQSQVWNSLNQNNFEFPEGDNSLLDQVKLNTKDKLLDSCYTSIYSILKATPMKSNIQTYMKENRSYATGFKKQLQADTKEIRKDTEKLLKVYSKKLKVKQKADKQAQKLAKKSLKKDDQSDFKKLAKLDVWDEVSDAIEAIDKKLKKLEKKLEKDDVEFDGKVG
ncbi:hypothetical protein [Candidatus Uabimicrobium amorphum]|uniref:Uncharacterized protein n=1 Tax=Uabimicrobium amorphum TaxID=2596890 RepID=A0A5S9ISW7_UABAM|nr:hypothetical protein [Candidatus Uabimicrobium amorphum]BBM87324.1 hypothetical protein UABAM_05733 [Candidatus Uabimicrobium amorphum]